MSAPVMHKLRGLSPRMVVEEKSELEKLVVKPTELEVETPISSPPPVDTISPPPSIDLAAEPDALPSSQPLGEVAQPSIMTESISPDISDRLNRLRDEGLLYRFEDIPIVLDLAPLAMSLSPRTPVPVNEFDITISVFQGEENFFIIHFYTHIARLNSIKDSLEDIASRSNGQVIMHDNYLSFKAPTDYQQIALRGILWLSVVEYLTQVEMNIKTLSTRFNMPRDGSILVIPPKRVYVKEKIPSKFTTFVYEADTREKYETEELWTFGKTLDIIMSRILETLSRGDGVAFVSAESNQEMEEIALFLLLVSEICGIGFSRW
jgi:hypothetical protein